MKRRDQNEMESYEQPKGGEAIMMRMKSLLFISLVVVCGVLLGQSCVLGVEPIKIGVIQPITGPVAYDGQLVVNGAKMAEEDINAAGGVLGRPIKLIVEDGKNDPAESVNAAERLIVRDKVPVLVGAWGSSSTLAVMPVVARYGIPLICETSTSPKITDPKTGNKWTFRTSSTNGIDALHLEKNIVKDLGFTKPAFLAVNNDWGRSVVQAYSEVIRRQGGNPVTTEYHGAGETNFYPFLTKIKASGADSLIITTDIQSIVMIAKQSTELGMTIKRMATSGFSPKMILDLAGPAAAEGLYLVDYFVPYAPTGEKAAEIAAFVERYAKKFPTEGLPDKYVASGYDAIFVICEAIKLAGSTDPGKIRDALEKVRYHGLTGYLWFDENRQARPTVYLTQVKGGKPIVVYSYVSK